MATETLIKFRQGTGTPAVGNATGGNSIGEPLWSTDLKKLYVTDGESAPVLIGPIEASYVQQSTINETNGTHIGTITIDGNETKIYAPTAGESVSQTLDVVNFNTDTDTPTLITLTGTNSIELKSSPANTNVTTVIAGEVAGASAESRAKLLFDVQINVIDGGTWTA